MKLGILIASVVLIGACSDTAPSPTLTFMPNLSLALEGDFEPPDAVILPDGVTPSDTGPEDTNSEDTNSEDTGPNPDTAPECTQDSDCEGTVEVGACTRAVCLDSGECGVADKAEGVTCDDSNACTELDACESGVCVGQAVVCEAEKACHVGVCDPEVGCEEVPVEDGTTCDDGILCTVIDTCLAGVCQSEEECDCTSDLDCPDDGNLCNGTPSCVDSKCQILEETIVTCPEGTACSESVCSEATGTCEDVLLDGADCDGGPCFQTGTCAAGNCKADAVICEDDNACTSDSCDVETGDCTFVAVPADSCDDGNPCTVDSCDPGKGCVFEAKSCDDGDACTEDACVPETGDCVGTAIACNDDDACTDDGCDPPTGCTAEKIVCDDENTCTLDSCDPATGCTTSPVDCSDGKPCTEDTCDVIVGCEYSDVICNDDNACTDDACVAGVGCEYTKIDCGDGGECGTPDCDPETGCFIKPIGCDDGNACTEDACDAEDGCTYTDVDCEDGDLCTNNACDKATGCIAKPTDCNDGKLCTEDLCDPESGCSHPPVICTNDDPCSAGKCNEDNGECVFKIVEGEECDDGDACTEGDICGLAGCLGEPINCGDDNPCVTGVCTDGDCELVSLAGLPCGDDDPCVTGVCEGESCDLTEKCDDGDPCTLDECTALGECNHKPDPACADEQCKDKSPGSSCNDGNANTTGDLCIGGQCAGFELSPVAIDFAFGDLIYRNVGYAFDKWTVGAKTANGGVVSHALVDITNPEAWVLYGGTSQGGTNGNYTAQHGAYAADTNGTLWVFDGTNWANNTAFSQALEESGSGDIYGLWSSNHSGEETVWIGGASGNSPYLRKCTAAGCDAQTLDLSGVPEDPIVKAIAGYEVCDDSGCYSSLALGADGEEGPSWNPEYVSHTFDNATGDASQWSQGLIDGGESQDQTLDIAAYGDGRFLAVGDNGYMRYRDNQGWGFAIDGFPGPDNSRTFTGVWVGVDVVLVSAYRDTGFNQQTLEIWSLPKTSNPENGNQWTIHELGEYFGFDSGLFDITGAPSGEIRAVGSGAFGWNAYQNGFIFIRKP